MDLFLLKKVLGALLMPINITLLLLICAIIFYRKRPGLSFKCLCSASLLLFLASIAPISDRLMSPLENQYASFTKKEQAIDYIIVLGCGHISNERRPATTQLENCALQRLIEAIRIYHLHPEAQLITSGANSHDISSNAEKLKQAAILLGVPAENIIAEHFPLDTEEEAELIAPRIKGHHAILVTNASHMPRALQYFHQQGVYPLPAPTGFWVKNQAAAKHWPHYVPNSKKLQQTTRVWYETLGLIVQKIKYWFN